MYLLKLIAKGNNILTGRQQMIACGTERERERILLHSARETLVTLPTKRYR